MENTGDTWVTVVCDTGDWADCPDAESAFVAALALTDDAKRARPMQGYQPNVTFWVDGKPVVSFDRKALLRQTGALKRAREGANG